MSTIQSIQSKEVTSPFYEDVPDSFASLKFPSIEPISWKDRAIKQINAFDLELEKAVRKILLNSMQMHKL